MDAAPEHAYGFQPRENVLENGLMLAGVISQPTFAVRTTEVIRSTAANGKRQNVSNAGAVHLRPTSPIVFIPHLISAPKNQYHFWKKLSSDCPSVSSTGTAHRSLSDRCQRRQCRLFLPKCAQVQDEVRDARLQRQGEPRRRPHVADRLRAKGADRRRRGEDRRAGEEGGELRNRLRLLRRFAPAGLVDAGIRKDLRLDAPTASLPRTPVLEK
jgi:hypothetical protein